MVQLKETLLALRKRLAEWIYPVDVLELTRRNLHAIVIKDSYIDDLQKEEREQMIAHAHAVYSNPSFAFVIDHLINEQIDETVKRASAMDAIWFGRGSINGQTLIKEEFERLSLIYKDRVIQNRVKDFDKFSVL